MAENNVQIISSTLKLRVSVSTIVYSLEYAMFKLLIIHEIEFKLCQIKATCAYINKHNYVKNI